MNSQQNRNPAENDLLLKEIELFRQGWDIVGRRSLARGDPINSDLEKRAEEIHGKNIEKKYISGKLDGFVTHSLMVRQKSDWLKRVKKAVKLNDEFELEDIEEDVNRERGYETDKKMIENIKFVLDREKMMPPDASIIIPQGGWVSDEIEDGYWRYQVDFMVYGKDPNKELFIGTAWGQGISPNDKKPNDVILQNMTVEVGFKKGAD